MRGAGAVNLCNIAKSRTRLQVTRACALIYTPTWTRGHTPAHSRTHAQARMDTRSHALTYTHSHARVHEHMHIYSHTGTQKPCAHAHTHTHTQVHAQTSTRTHAFTYSHRTHNDCKVSVYNYGTANVYIPPIIHDPQYTLHNDQGNHMYNGHTEHTLNTQTHSAHSPCAHITYQTHITQ